jgi:hypothetical protein
MLASTDGAVRRSFERAQEFTLTDSGLHFSAARSVRMVLKPADFANGEPATDEEPPAPRALPETHPKWANRLCFDASDRETDDKFTTIPASRNAIAMTDEGTIYYIDPTGTLLRTSP